MKKLIAIVILLGAIAAAAYLAKEGHIPGLQTDSMVIKRQTYRFFECIKFKEFTEAANFHDEVDRKKADIPKMLEDLFKVPPENLDFQDIHVADTSIDSSGELGKTRTQVVVKLLNTNKIKRPEMILYWKKSGDQWFLKLESSIKKAPQIK